MKELIIDSIDGFSNVDEKISMSIDSAKGVSIDLLSVGSGETPIRIGKVYNFLINFGYTGNNVVKMLSNAIGIDYYNTKDIYDSRVLSNELVAKDSVLYSTRPIAAELLLEEGLLPGIKKIGGISEKDISEAREQIGVKHYYLNVGLKKLFQDMVLYAYNNAVRYLSIYEKRHNFFVLYSNSYYSYKPEAVEIDRNEFEALVEYLRGVFSRDYERSDLYGVIEYDLSKETIHIEVIISESERNITMGLLYRGNDLKVLYGNTKVQNSLELHNGLSLFSYDVSETRDKLLLSLRMNLEDDCIMYAYDSNIVNFPEADISIKMNTGWNISPKIRQANIILVEISDYKNIYKINDLSYLSVPIIIIMPSGGIVNAINKFNSESDLFINRYDYYHAVPNTCSYCATTDVLQYPFTYRDDLKTGYFVSSGTEVVKRNKDGCPRCNFGMDSFVIYVDRLKVNGEADALIKSGQVTRESLELLKSSYDDSTSEIISRIHKKEIDPVDLVGK